MTKKYKTLYLIFRIISMLVVFGPLVAYIIMAFNDGSATEKFTLGSTVVICIILTVINVVAKQNIRSTIWILVLGVYFCLDDIQPLLICIATATIIDEFVLTPLYKSFKNKYTINKEIDKRL